MNNYIFSYDVIDTLEDSDDDVLRDLINFIHPSVIKNIERGVATTLIFDSTKSIGQLETTLNQKFSDRIYYYLAEIKQTDKLHLVCNQDLDLVKHFRTILKDEEDKRNNDQLPLKDMYNL